MKTFTIDAQNQIVAFATPEEAAAASATPFDTFTSQKELADLATQWPAERLLAVWNSLPGVAPVQKVKSAKAVIGRIWERIENLGEPAPTNAPQKASVRARVAHRARAKKAAKHQAPTTKSARKAKTRTQAAATAPREGSKAAQVVALLRRKNGATLSEIAEKMGWQKHTVRGFMAGTMKRAGYRVESFKPEGRARSYRLPQ
jgi:hypothetical protein